MRLDRRGSVLGIFAILFSVMLLFSAVSIDLARTYLVRSRLQTSTDAAALLGAREEQTASMKADAVALFTTNFNSNAPTGGANLMNAVVTNVSVILDQNTGVVTVTATASVPTTFLKMFPWAPSQLTVTTLSTSQATSSRMEIALVLDTTGSMAQTDGSTGSTKLKALQNAVSDLLGVLYGTKDTTPDLWVSVVPFITSINIGTGSLQQSWLKKPRPTTDYRHNNSVQYSWGGCVEARIDGGSNDDETEVSPQDHPFLQYYAEDTYGAYQKAGSGNSGTCPVSSRYGNYTYSNGVCMGDNDWGAPSNVNTSRNPALFSGLKMGPNRGCPSTIMPLTASRTTIMNKVNSLTVDYSGTIVGLGLQGGWFTLSPDWRGSNGWGDAELPHDYAMTSASSSGQPVSKIVVLVSDGDNVWGYAPSVAPGNITVPTSLYMPYGRLSNTNNPLGIFVGRSYSTMFSNSKDELDQRWQAVCSNMKNDGIKIYVVGLGVSSETDRKLLKACSSGEEYYYIESPSASDLDAAFLKVAHQISQLRLVR